MLRRLLSGRTRIIRCEFIRPTARPPTEMHADWCYNHGRAGGPSPLPRLHTGNLTCSTTTYTVAVAAKITHAPPWTRGGGGGGFRGAIIARRRRELGSAAFPGDVYTSRSPMENDDRTGDHLHHHPGSWPLVSWRWRVKVVSGKNQNLTHNIVNARDNCSGPAGDETVK